MPPYEKKILEDTAKLTQENNKILREMRRTARWLRFFGIVKWGVIIIVTIGAYYFVQPYTEILSSIYGGEGGILPDISLFEEAIKKLPVGAPEGLFKGTATGTRP